MARPTPFADVVAFHGGACPQLALGYRLAHSAMDRLAEMGVADGGLVTVVEAGGCGTDAVQCVSGCTSGNGTLIYKGGWSKSRRWSRFHP